MTTEDARGRFLDVLAQAGTVVLGKEAVLRLALCCVLARGHVLLEDVPGVGKTTLAQTLAQLLGLRMQRVQCTSDMLPADLIGVSVYEREAGRFRFHPGPLFAPVVLADEINRATPKTQSALLEAMEERQISAEGETFALPPAFFVIATQNPLSQLGTFPLPESQLDRFLMRLHLGYPPPQAECELLRGEDRRTRARQLAPVLDEAALLAAQEAVRAMPVSPALAEYVQRLLAATRTSPELLGGLSPRCGLGLLAAARAWAWLDGRDFAVPEDVQRVFAPVTRHRLRRAADHGDVSEAVLDALLHAVALPG